MPYTKWHTGAMYNYMHSGYGYGYAGLGLPLWAPGLIIILGIWRIFWKGLALWHSAKRGEKWWFIALLLINTLGILELVYLFSIAKLSRDELFTMK